MNKSEKFVIDGIAIPIDGVTLNALKKSVQCGTSCYVPGASCLFIEHGTDSLKDFRTKVQGKPWNEESK